MVDDGWPTPHSVNWAIVTFSLPHSILLSSVVHPPPPFSTCSPIHNKKQKKETCLFWILNPKVQPVCCVHFAKSFSSGNSLTLAGLGTFFNRLIAYSFDIRHGEYDRVQSSPVQSPSPRQTKGKNSLQKECKTKCRSTSKANGRKVLLFFPFRRPTESTVERGDFKVGQKPQVTFFLFCLFYVHAATRKK